MLRIALAVVGLALGSGVEPARADTSAFTGHLAQHRGRVDLESASFSFDPEFYRNRLILLGEVHGMAIGQKLDLALLKHLVARAGVRTYVAEVDFAQAAHINRYLRSGDIAQLDAVFAGWARRGLQWANVEFRDKLLLLRAMNLSLPATRRVHLFGADALQDAGLACDEIAALLPRTDAAFAALRELAAHPERCLKPGLLAATAAQALKAWAPRQRPAWPARRRSDALRIALESLAIDARVEDRERQIAAKIELLMSLPGSRERPAYGLWGLFHVVQAPVSGSEPMAYMLGKPGAPLAGRVTSVVIMNLASSMMIPTGPDAAGKMQYSAIPYTLDSQDAALLNGIETLKQAALDDLTMFRLGAPGSPFIRAPILDDVGGRMGEMQPFRIDMAAALPAGALPYVILATGSPATTPLGAKRD
jgi:hypothetical protein